MKKKIVKILGVFVLLVVVILIAAPLLLKGKIEGIIKDNINKNVNATFDFAEADLSLLSSFPNAEVSLNQVALVNKAPFEGDTLFAAKEVSLTMGIMQLFKGVDDGIAITSLVLDEALVHVKVDKEENANYDIAIEDTEAPVETTEETTGGFVFNMDSYEIINSKVLYDDFATGMHLEILEMNHNGTGNLSLETSELDTHTDALISFEMDSTNYLNKNKIKLDALIGIDLNESKYSFLKNEALLNSLPLVFDGFIKLNDNNQEVAITFKTPSSDFKNFLAVIPAEYSKNIEDVKTTGNFAVSGNFEGIVDDTHIPKFDIKINSDNASFKYPDLPKSVRNVFIDTEIQNTTGIVEDTFVDIRKLSFMIDEDKFNMTSKITDLLGNTKVNAHIDGKMNLANISKAYPVPADLNLKGLLSADITTAFDMASIENEQYENTKTSGKMNLKGFEYASPEMGNPVQINTIAMNFTPTKVNLTELNGKTGQTDFNATGGINNLLGFMFNDEDIEGNFDLKSNVFALNDFMIAEEEESETTTTTTKTDAPAQGVERIKIPAFLNANINAAANTVLYDNLVLKNVSGSLKIKDETAILSDMTSSIFNGKIAFNGKVSTKQDVSTFDMNLGLEQLQIAETFKSLELFKAIAPIAEIIQGSLSSTLALSGNLTDELTPDLLSLNGDMLANILAREISSEKSPILSALDGKLGFINMKELNLKELKTKLSFKDGLVSVKPFTINYKDIAINIDGSHTFDKKMNYKATLDVPAKYLGTEVNSLIAKIDEKELEGMTVPVIANIGGLYTSPEVTTDLTSSLKNLTSKLVEIQKQKLIGQGTDKAKDLLGSVLSGNSKTDTTKTTTDTAVKDVLGGILGNKTKDTTSAKTAEPTKNEATKDAAKKVLGGLFGKKKDTVKKN